MSELYELPNGWEWHRLDEVSTFYNGRAYKKEELLEEGKYRVLRVGNFFTNNNWYYSDLELEDNKYCNKGDLLYAWSASFGPKIWNEDKVIYHYHIWKVVPNYDLIGRDYLFHFLNWDTDKIKSDKGSGATMIHITKGSIEERKIPLPPLTEQQRIVEKLDQLFEKIDKAISLHQKNIDEADAFMGSALNEVFGELEEKYEKKSIGSIANVGTGLTPLKSRADFYSNGSVNWITSSATNDDFVYSTEQLITKAAVDECRLKVYPIGTIIVALYGQGKTRGQVSELMIETTTNQALATIVVDGITSTNKYLKAFLKKSYLDLRAKASGGTQANLNLGIIKETELPIPPLSVQQKVVTYLDDLSDKIERVKTVQKEKMDSLKALKASILDKAFRGEL